MRRLGVPALAVVALAPIWAAASLPTQDGPSHVLNAIVFRACGDPATRETAFYERRLELIPNWTAHLVLLGLTRVVPVLAAEKVLASVCVLSLFGGLAYFLRPFGGGTSIAALSLLLAYNRCFFLGFYNYLFGLALLFVILGVFVRGGRTPTPGRLALVSALLCWRGSRTSSPSCSRRSACSGWRRRRRENRGGDASPALGSRVGPESP